MPKIHYTRFPVTAKLPTCYRLVADFSDTANKSATSWQQVVVTEFGKRHDTTDTTPAPTCYVLATGKRCTGFWLLLSQYAVKPVGLIIALAVREHLLRCFRN